jgi:ribonuclease VapC
MSAATHLQIAVVSDPVSVAVAQAFDEMIGEAAIEIVPFAAGQAGLARYAYRRFGRGSGHPARLDVGDCFCYAPAIERSEPLLYKGDDLDHTDVRGAPGLTAQARHPQILWTA